MNKNSISTTLKNNSITNIIKTCYKSNSIDFSEANRPNYYVKMT